MTDIISFGLVSMLTWLSPMPTHAQGKLVAYGSDYVLRASAEYRGYDVSPYRDVISGMSPSDLGKVAWVRLADGSWYGPLLVGDAGARHDFYQLVFIKREIAEIGNRLREKLGFVNGQYGEVAVGLCPPPANSIAVNYRPHLKFSDEGRLNWQSWPKQELPVNCTMYGDGKIYNGAQ